MPIKRDFSDSITNSFSPSDAPKEKAILGPSKGAITMAPTITARLFLVLPLMWPMKKR